MTASAAPLPAVRNWTGPLMVLAGGVGIGFAPIGLRLGLHDLGPQAIAFWRYAFALPVLFALVLLIERRLPHRPNRFIFLAGTFFADDLADGLTHPVSIIMAPVFGQGCEVELVIALQGFAGPMDAERIAQVANRLKASTNHITRQTSGRSPDG